MLAVDDDSVTRLALRFVYRERPIECELRLTRQQHNEDRADEELLPSVLKWNLSTNDQTELGTEVLDDRNGRDDTCE